MKKKRTILGVLLTLMLLGSLVAATAPVSAGTLSWTDYDIPSTTGNVLASIDVNDIAVFDEDTIFAAGEDDTLYKSTNGGETWSTIDASSGTDVDLVAVAPDDEDLLIYADTATDEVYVSTNGGSSWSALDLSGTSNAGTSFEVRDITLSAESSGIHYIGVAGEDSGPIAEVWTYNIGSASPSWDEISADTGFEADSDNYSTAAAIAYSPNFAGDQVLLVLTEHDDGVATTGTDEVLLEIYSENSDKWNDDAGFAGYAVALFSDDGISDLTQGWLSLDPEYLGSDDAMRLAFAGVTLDGDADAKDDNGIWRVSDTSVKGLKTGDSVEIHSVAYDGANLVAGRYDTNTTYYSDDPTASSPTVSTTRTYKRPGGSSMVVVAWAGSNAVAGTSGDESAFAVSTDLGKTYNDVSLIDTDMSTSGDLEDFAISADGSVKYLVTSDDEDDLSVWREASSWQRILSVQDTYDYIVRLAPDDPNVLYVAERGGRDIYYSKDGGLERWQKRAGRYDTQDLAVETDGDVLYVLIAADGKVSKSTNSGFTWGGSKSTKLSSGYMLRSLGEDLLIAGSQDGKVAYSSDGGSTWTKPGDSLTSSSNTSVTASGLDDGDFIYAGTHGSTIERWEIGSSSSFKTMTSVASGYGVHGIELVDGVLYAITSNGSASKLYRTISPTASGISSAYFDVVDKSVDFGIHPQGLRASSGSTKLWAIDYDGPDLYSFTDTLAAAVPTLTAPKQDFTVKVNPITGRAVMVTFIWQSPSDVDDFQIEIAFDDGFDEVVLSEDVGESGDEGDTISKVIGPYASDPFDLEWNFDTIYFWRVRVKGNSPVKSGWSEVRRFSIEEAAVQPPVEVTIPPTPPPPEITVTPPDVVVNVPPLVQVPPAPAPITPAWIWVIVIIGGVLVIALIILIVRTRRAV